MLKMTSLCLHQGIIFCGIVLAVYVTSFLLPVLPVPDRILSYPGWLAFWRAMTGGVIIGRSSNGLTDPFSWSFFLLWCANPIFWMGIYFLTRERWLYSGIAGLLAASLSSICYFINNNSGLIPTGYRYHDFNDRLLIGYYIWLLSMCLLFISSSLGGLHNYYSKPH